MKHILALALLACLSSGACLADTLVIGMEQGLVPGFSASWAGTAGGYCGAAPDGHGSNCVFIPAGKTITHVYGTETLKRDGIELLGRFICGMGGDATTVWEGEHLTKGTVPVATPRLPADYRLTGDGWRACWYEWQAINSGGYTGSGGGFEIQVVLTVE